MSLNRVWQRGALRYRGDYLGHHLRRQSCLKYTRSEPHRILGTSFIQCTFSKAARLSTKARPKQQPIQGTSKTAARPVESDRHTRTPEPASFTKKSLSESDSSNSPSRSVAPAPATYNVSAAASDTDQRTVERAKRLLGGHDEILLYTAPSHKSLVFTSILGGATFLTVCQTAAQSMMLLPNASIVLKVPALVGAAIGMAISFTLLSTPIRQIQSLRLIRDPQQGICMQVESKSRLLTSRKRRFNVALADIRSDRNIKASAVTFRSVHRADGFKWTEIEHEERAEKSRLSSRLALAWKDFSLIESLQNMWPAITRDTGRMFARTGMTYIRIEKQNWKLDLTNCLLLDRGFPLTELIKEDAEVRDSVLGIIRRQFSSV